MLTNCFLNYGIFARLIVFADPFQVAHSAIAQQFLNLALTKFASSKLWPKDISMRLMKECIREVGITWNMHAICACFLRRREWLGDFSAREDGIIKMMRRLNRLIYPWGLYTIDDVVGILYGLGGVFIQVGLMMWQLGLCVLEAMWIWKLGRYVVYFKSWKCNLIPRK